MPLAIFDLDNTLIAGDSDHLWGEYLVEQGLVDGPRHQQANDQFYADYQQGCLDIHAFLAFSLQPLTLEPVTVLQQRHAVFMQTKIQPLMLPKARQLIAWHQAQGDTLLIITATNHFVTAPIAAALGVPNLLATMPESKNGYFTGRIVGEPCFQQGKVTRLMAWMEQQRHSLQDSWFYSDSNNDLPLLSQVTHPVVVDPDAALARAAQQRQWPMISLR